MVICRIYRLFSVVLLLDMGLFCPLLVPKAQAQGGAAGKPMRAAPPPENPLYIEKNGVNIAGQRRNCYAGEKISLLGAVKNGAPLQFPSWHVDSGGYDQNPIADWQIAPDNNTAKIIPLTDISHQRIDFYWMAGAGVKVILTAEVNGKWYHASVTYDVKRPEHSVTTAKGTVIAKVIQPTVLLDHLVRPGMMLADGDVFEGLAPGVKWTSVFPKGLYGGTVQWVQIIESIQTSENMGPQHSPPDIHTPGLDETWPYTTGLTAQDSPFSGPIGNGINDFSRVDHFHMYLMWQPPGGIFVPLAKWDWGWSGEASLDNGVWKLVDGTATQTGPTETDGWTVEPEWVQNAHPPRHR